MKPLASSHPVVAHIRKDDNISICHRSLIQTIIVDALQQMNCVCYRKQRLLLLCWLRVYNLRLIISAEQGHYFPVNRIVIGNDSNYVKTSIFQVHYRSSQNTMEFCTYPWHRKYVSNVFVWWKQWLNHKWVSRFGWLGTISSSPCKTTTFILKKLLEIYFVHHEHNIPFMRI